MRRQNISIIQDFSTDLCGGALDFVPITAYNNIVRGRERRDRPRSGHYPKGETMRLSGTYTTLTEWIKKQDAIVARIARAKRTEKLRGIAAKVGKAIAKEAGLLAIMMVITLGVVYFETRDIHQAAKVAMLAVRS